MMTFKEFLAEGKTDEKRSHLRAYNKTQRDVKQKLDKIQARLSKQLVPMFASTGFGIGFDRRRTEGNTRMVATAYLPDDTDIRVAVAAIKARVERQLKDLSESYGFTYKLTFAGEGHFSRPGNRVAQVVYLLYGTE